MPRGSRRRQCGKLSPRSSSLLCSSCVAPSTQAGAGAAAVPPSCTTVSGNPPCRTDAPPAAGLPRANITCDAEHPEGTYQPPNMTVMQQARGPVL